MRRAWLALTFGAVLLLLATSWWALKVLAGREYAARIWEAKAAIRIGAIAKARRVLEQVVSRWPGRGEAEYLLGACEKALGREGEAQKAWGSVPPGSPYAGHAALMLAREALAKHRLAEAERHLPTALNAPGPNGVEARETLLYLYKLEGRIEEARRLVRAGWDHYPDRVGTLQESWRLDTPSPIPLDRHRGALDLASSSNPDDDRIWLGRAYLAIRVARFEEATGWLEACRRRRPRDAAVWRVWLDWALATQDVAMARQALDYLPAELVPPTEVLALGGWFAARAGDAAGERRALARLVAIAPGSIQSLERLSGLARQAGEDELCARLRRRKQELDGIQTQYARRIFGPDPIADAGKLARWAEELGRLFDARCWWDLAVRRDPARRAELRGALERIARAESRRSEGTTLPELLAALGPPSSGGRLQPPGRLARCLHSSMTPRPPGYASSSSAAGPRSGKSPRRWAVGSACWISTATAGSTSISSKAGPSPPTPLTHRPATACSVTGVTAPSRM